MIRRYQITVNDQAYDVTVEAGTPADRPADPALIPRCSTGKRPASTGTGMSAHVLLPRPAGAAGEIIAPVAGEILEVLAAPGQKVLAGDVLFILDAMKLENELTAPRDGAVAEVRVSPGDRVEAGAPLCQIR